MKFFRVNPNVIKESIGQKTPIKQLDEIELIEASLDDNLGQEVKIPKDVLDSFKIKDTLNPKIWENFKLNPEVQTKLIKIANEFIKEMKLPKGFKLDDIIFTGSLANYNWSKFSDIDLHIVLDYKQFEGDPQMVEDFFYAQKTLWNDTHDITVFDYPVELYAQDTNQELVATAVYSVLKGKWIKKPIRENFKLDKEAIKNKAQKFINKLKDIRDDYKKDDFKAVVDKVTKIKDKIKQMRKAGLEGGGEFSQENLVFKTLRRTPFMDVLDSFKVKSFDKLMSVMEIHENVNKTFSYKFHQKDEDTFYISAKYKGQEVGYIMMDIMMNAYYYFEDIMSEDEYNELFPNDEFVRIEWLKVDPDYRGKGISKQLLAMALDRIKKMGYNQVYLNASPIGGDGLPLNDLVNLYKSFGFKEIINQGNNIQMILNMDSLNEVKYLPYDDKAEMKAASAYPSLSQASSRADIKQVRYRIAKAINAANQYKSANPNDNYFVIPQEGDGFYQVEFRHDGNIRTKQIRPSGDMEQRGGSFQPSDVGTCKTYQNIARYCFVKAGKNGRAVGASPAEDAANKALIIYQNEIMDFYKSGDYGDENTPQYADSKMDDKIKLHKMKKDLETKLRRRVTDAEWQEFLNTGKEPKPKSGLTMSPEEKELFNKQQAEKQARIDALKAKMKR